MSTNMTGASGAEQHTLLAVATGRATWREVARASEGHRLRFAGVFVLGLVSAALGIVVPSVLGWFVDQVSEGVADLLTVALAVALAIISVLLSAIGSALTIVIAARSYHSMLAELRERLVERAMTLPQHVVEEAGTGDLISRTSDDVAEVADAAPSVIPAFTTVSFAIIATFGGMTALDWRYGAALAILLPVYWSTMRWYLATGPKVYRAERAAMSTRAQQIIESQRGFETVLGFGLSEHRHERVLQASWGVVPHAMRARTVQNMFFTRLNVAEYLGLAAILVVGFLLIGADLSTVGAATTAMLLVIRLFGPVNRLLFVIDDLQSALASLTRIVGVITIPVDASREAESAGDLSLESPSEAAAVRLEGVGFAYGTGPAVLDNVDLAISAGERVAVVGPSGAGKTTLAGVVAGIHRADSGSIVRPERTVLVTQEIHVFAGTLRDNLTLAAPEASDDDVLAALDALGASALLDVLPEGLETTLGVGAHALTAAQAQQLALARVLLANPELVILDEATAEAGSAQAGLLDRASERVLRGRTGIVVAHRLSQAAACDRIVVLDNGRIIEDGTHDELLAAGGSYAGLWEMWQRAREVERVE